MYTEAAWSVKSERDCGLKIVLKVLLGLLLVFVALYYFIYPSVTVYRHITADPSPQSGVPAFAFDVHSSIAEGFGGWARERVARSAGAELSIHDISGTEWPMFSAVYFLWGTEELDKAWLAAGRSDRSRPSAYAAEAIEAAARLVVDPANASWVIKHWGERYLDSENVFYRMLLIAGLTSYQSITGNAQYEPLLRQQVVSLSNELDQSPHGVLDDYPGQCYPIDILPAIAVMKRAGDLLDIDLSPFVERARRGFEGNLLDPETRLPSYLADPRTGVGIGPARGVGISYMLIWAREIWPETAEDWYGLYERHFVDRGAFVSGIREFPKGVAGFSWLGDVDSGPILGGLGVAASAFGIAAARVNGDTELAHALSTQAILASWPLPSGRLLVPSLLSDLSDAPFLGETALIFVFSRPMASPAGANEADTPDLVHGLLAVMFLLGLLLLLAGLRLLLRAVKRQEAH